MASLLEMSGISKRYGGAQALDKVDFRLERGEIVCLLGENGAGKSTLMKILCGAVQSHEGEVRLDGHPVRFKDTAQAYARGIGVVFQELNLCPNLGAAENLALGAEPSRGPAGLGLDREELRRRSQAAFASLGISIDPDLPVRHLGVGQRQMIEIAKALASNPRLLILDEPTSALSEHETTALLQVLRGLKARGLGMVYISHKLSEIGQICDRVVCLRDGKNAGEAPATASQKELVAMMVGRELAEPAQRRSVAAAEPLLRVESMSGHPGIEDVSFQIRPGEVLGLGGLMGAGRTELARLLIGAEPARSGRVYLEGRRLELKDPGQAVAAGLAYLPEDRRSSGLVGLLSVAENCMLSASKRVAGPRGWIRRGRPLALARLFIRRLRIKADPGQGVMGLSGGNQQKVVLAKCLAGRPKVLILDEPTRGIDVGAKAEVHKLILALASKGLAVLLISSELPELLSLSDRILVMRGGRLAGEFPRAEASEAAIMHAAVG